MAKPDVLTMSTISLAVMVVSGFLWAQAYFMTRADADAAHASFKYDMRSVYLELKIDSANTEMSFIEQSGVGTDEKRKYDLLKFSVERMTQALMGLEK